MVERSGAGLRQLAAEVRGEIERIARTAADIEQASRLQRSETTKLELYGAAALLETFYSGHEKTFTRIASALGEVPSGRSWHRTLLDAMSLDIPKLRPPVLSAETTQHLHPFLAFRHRFRNLYLFELDREVVFRMLDEAGPVWSAARAELESFAETLERMADQLEQPG